MSLRVKIALTTALLYLAMVAPGLAIVVVKRQGLRYYELENKGRFGYCIDVSGNIINRIRDLLQIIRIARIQRNFL